MPLEFAPLTTSDTLAWTRIRSKAYEGLTNQVVHTKLPVAESTVQGVADDRKKEIGKPNTWHWKIVDTDLAPSPDDPEDNGGRTIAVSIWSAHNVNEDGKPKIDGSNEPTTNPAEIDPAPEQEEPPFLPPELRVDVLMALLTPMRDAQREIMGSRPYFMLNTLCTDPQHQKRGAASIMLKWGMEKADELDLETYLDSSQVARPIYEKLGFEFLKWVEFDRVPWGGEGVDRYGCMVRKARRKEE
jgi:GNAT superfamily N-acetyltransferase